jgi:hypothetical protein
MHCKSSVIETAKKMSTAIRQTAVYSLPELPTRRRDWRIQYVRQMTRKVRMATTAPVLSNDSIVISNALFYCLIFRIEKEQGRFERPPAENDSNEPNGLARFVLAYVI